MKENIDSIRIRVYSAAWVVILSIALTGSKFYHHKTH